MKHFLRLTSSIIIVFAINSGLMAQDGSPAYEYASAEKAEIVYPAVPSSEASAAFSTDYMSKVNPKATKNFNRLFAGASEVKWYKEKDGIHAWGKKSGNSIHAVYNPNGKLMYSVTNFQKGKAPAVITDYVANNYAGYEVFQASEIKTITSLAHQVILKKDNRFVKLTLP